MRAHRICVLATLVLASPALVSGAAAQVRRGGGGGGAPAAPHISAPAAAPRISAPAATPHFSAPAPHFAAPAPRIAAPRFSAPSAAAPRFSAPRAASPRIASPRSTLPGITRRNAGVTGPAANRLDRNALAPSRTPPNNGALVGNGPNRLRDRGNAPSTVGQGTAGPVRNAAGALQASRQGTRGDRILRNPALANLSPRDPAARSLSRATFQGRFAQSAFARDFDRGRRHHRHFGVVLGFAGPLFWPYAYDDFIDYTFWPAAYDTFWPYAYDDVFEGLYGAYAPQYGAAYAYAGAPASDRAYASRGGAAPGNATQICSGEAQGLTDFPIERITSQVEPSQEQQALLANLKAATDKAVGIMQAACPGDLPATPTGRLAAMRIRVVAMLQAVQTVRPALDAFYRSLSDEQKERFNALDESNSDATARPRPRPRSPQPQIGQLCGSRGSSVVNLPIARIQQSLRLSEAQDAALQAVNEASVKAADILNASCPAGQDALTPPGRIAAMEQRLNAMLQAIETVRPALTKFYGSLSDEQKARFDRLGVRPT
jgi:ABC-type transporter MlaC component